MTSQRPERELQSHRDDRLSSSFRMYSTLANTCGDSQVVVGRTAAMRDKEPCIFEDIRRKLAVQPGDHVLSIGVGCGQIASWWMRSAAEMSLSLYLNDFPDVLERIASDLLPVVQSPPKEVLFVPGIFPVDTASSLAGARFDCIDIYSVVHYTDQPLALVASAVDLLRPGGRLLIGDVPNLDKKGRFLSSATGRSFEAQYRNVPVADIPVYRNHHEFTEAALAEGQAPLTDAFLTDLLESYRRKGYDAYVLNQPPTLPFCHTREDLLIVAPHA